jgi:2-polyprenyl-6-methoxyphenol hydroxylase-like FAD-dependent oxidoreductase
MRVRSSSAMRLLVMRCTSTETTANRKNALDLARVHRTLLGMKTILISGASVAGTALAHHLQRYGFEVTVVERAPAPRTGGYAVDVRGPAIDVLARTGVLANARALQCDTIATTFLDGSGRGAVDMPRGIGVLDANDLEIMRADLVQVLYDTTRGKVNYQFSDSITAIEQRQSGVQVCFERGGTRGFDLVIGADGVHSNVRRLCFGDEAQWLEFLGSYMAIFTAPNLLGVDRWQYVQNTPGCLVSVKSTNGNAELKVVLFFSSPQLELDYSDVARQRQLTAAAFAGSGWELPRLLPIMQAAPDFYFDAMCQVHMPSWSQGRVALVGDAAWCPSPLAGQGSSMALIGAYVLAGELAANGGDHVRAFANYESATRAFMQGNLDYSKSMVDGFAPKTKLGIWARNRFMGMLRYMPGNALLMKLMMSGLVKVANAITLRDYEAYAISGQHVFSQHAEPEHPGRDRANRAELERTA